MSKPQNNRGSETMWALCPPTTVNLHSLYPSNGGGVKYRVRMRGQQEAKEVGSSVIYEQKNK